MKHTIETGVIQRVPESEVSCHYSLVCKFLNSQRGEGYGFFGLGLGPIQEGCVGAVPVLLHDVCCEAW